MSDAENTTREKIAAIRARAKAATDGPWSWLVAPRWHDAALVTQLPKLGRTNVMDFVRWGMQGAAPRFLKDRYFMQPIHDGVGVDHPDAQFIAHAREDIPFLLDQLDALIAAFPTLTATGDPDDEQAWIEYMSTDDFLQLIPTPGSMFRAGYRAALAAVVPGGTP